jgi:hypothetical protein
MQNCFIIKQTPKQENSKMINSELLVNIGQSAFNIGQSVDDIVSMVEGIQGSTFEDQAVAVKAYYEAKKSA